MKNIVTTFPLVVFFMINLALGQPRGDMNRDQKSRVESMKIAFITQKLSLNPEEAKTFWPVYNQYWSELESIRNTRRTEVRSAFDDIDSLSDKEIGRLIDEEIGFRQKELDVVKKYHAKFKQVLPVKKVALLYKSEEEFKRVLLRKIHDRGQNHPPRKN